jgi:hypothetical protein
LSGTFRPYEKLVEITILGRHFLVPDKNTLLRCFQFISPQTIPFARFCWNQECEYCRVTCQLSDDDAERSVASCEFMVSAGLGISSLSPELQTCLQAKLGVREADEVCSAPADVSAD